MSCIAAEEPAGPDRNNRSVKSFLPIFNNSQACITDFCCSDWGATRSGKVEIELNFVEQYLTYSFRHWHLLSRQ